MTPAGAGRPAGNEGADFRLEPSPYGNQQRRAEWVERIAALPTFEDAVAALLDWRETRRHQTVSDQDDLWIEARLEDKVAVGRFSAMTYPQVRSETLTGETVDEVRNGFLQRAEDAAGDTAALEAIVNEFRHRYRPPIMPSSPFMRTETELAEMLMKTRERGWYRQSIDELRESRGVIVHKRGVVAKGGT